MKRSEMIKKLTVELLEVDTNKKFEESTAAERTKYEHLVCIVLSAAEQYGMVPPEQRSCPGCDGCNGETTYGWDSE